MISKIEVFLELRGVVYLSRSQGIEPNQLLRQGTILIKEKNNSGHSDKSGQSFVKLVKTPIITGDYVISISTAEAEIHDAHGA